MSKTVKKTKIAEFSERLSSKAKEDFKRIPFARPFYFFLAVNVFVIIMAVLAQKRLPPQIPLYYGLPRGEQQLSDKAGILIPNIISLSVLIINTTLSYLVKDEFLKKTLVVFGFVTVILATVTTLKIILLVGNLW